MKFLMPWPAWLSIPQSKRWPIQFLVRAHAQLAGLVQGWGCWQEATNGCFSLTLSHINVSFSSSLSPYLPFSINKQTNKLLKKKKKQLLELYFTNGTETFPLQSEQGEFWVLIYMKLDQSGMGVWGGGAGKGTHGTSLHIRQPPQSSRSPFLVSTEDCISRVCKLCELSHVWNRFSLCSTPNWRVLLALGWWQQPFIDTMQGSKTGTCKGLLVRHWSLIE